MMRIWTASLSQWRNLKHAQIELVDTTAKTGIPAFAPLFSNVIAYKKGELTEHEYTERYLGKMQESFKLAPAVWGELFTKGDVAYACYCRAGTFCHRHLFVKFLSERLAAREIEHELMGEFSKT